MAAHDPSRRSLFVGRASAEPALRPPWALDEAAFIDTCTGCNACVQQCPERVLATASGGYPVFDPRLGECTFCGTCADACQARALDRSAGQAPWSYRAHVAASCLTQQGVVCASCRDACPEHAIAFRPAVPVASPAIDADRCSGCGACVGACPVSAISIRPHCLEVA